MKNTLLLFMLLMSSTYVNSQSMHEICPLKVGADVPSETNLKSTMDKELLLKDIIDETPTVLVVYRGHW